MPRPLLAILKACWAILAWVLFLSGVIGCSGGGGGDTATHTDAVGDAVAPDAVHPELFLPFEHVVSIHGFDAGGTDDALD